MTKKPQILLGTAQWGLDYGINNNNGKIKKNEIDLIFQFCLKNKINVFDTARDYGNAEKTLGNLIKKYKSKAKIISKIKNFKLNSINFNKKKIKELILETHRNTFQNSIEGILLHDDSLLNHKYFPDLWNLLVELKNEFKIKKIGISTYKNNLNYNIIKKYKFDIVQIPYNVYDQTRYDNGFLRTLKDNDIEIHVRSVFLQGILLLNYKQLNSFFSPIREHQKKMHNYFELQGMTIMEGCLRAVLQNQFIDKVIIGCDNLLQLKQIYKSYLKVKNLKKNKDFKKFKIKNKKIINPNLWDINEI